VKVDGFRPGKAPNNMVEDKIKKESLLMEAGDIAVRETYIKYIKDSKLEPVGNPEVSIVKILDPRSLGEVGAKEVSSHSAEATRDKAFVFKALITVLPEVDLPDYKEIAKKVKGKDVEVTEQEVQDALNYLQKSRAKMILKNDVAALKDFVEIEYSCNQIENGKTAKDQFILGEGGMIKGFEDNIVGMKEGQEKTFTIKFPEKSPFAGKDGEFKVKIISVRKMELPEINDEFAKQLGVFDTLVALKASLKEGITLEKKEAEKQRVRGEILEKIAEKSYFEMPESMVEYEQQRLLEDLKNRITQTIKNITFEQYLASVKKTEQELKETYKKEAEKRLRGFLVLRELSKKENIEVLDKEVEEEINKSTKNYSKEDLAKVDTAELKEYTKGVIQNEKIFTLLENLSK
jgi:trigger factor